MEQFKIEIIEPMTASEAEKWKIEVESTGQRLGQLLYEGYKRNAWQVLGYGSWTQCVRELAERSGFSRVHGFRLFENERLKNDVLTPGDSLYNLVPLGTERQTRPLSKLSTDDEKREVWQVAVETAPSGNFTAKHVEETVENYQETKTITAEKAKDYITLAEWQALPQDRQTELITRNYQTNATFNKTNDSIEWARWSWNPITGCLHNCVYCYARDIAARFFPQNFEPSFLPPRLKAPENTKQPDFSKITDPIERMGQRNVFVCSMADLFGKWIPVEWINAVLENITQNPQWTFLLLTKFPIRMSEFDYPDNVWLGTTVDYQHAVKRAESAFSKIKDSGFSGVCWLSCEPMMENLEFNSLAMFDWVVMGGASKSSQSNEFAPPFDWIVKLHNQSRKANCKIYQKTNLMPGISNQQRVREYPNDTN